MPKCQVQLSAPQDGSVADPGKRAIKVWIAGLVHWQIFQERIDHGKSNGDSRHLINIETFAPLRIGCLDRVK